MILISKSGFSIVNFEKVIELYESHRQICVRFQSGTTTKLAEYNTADEAGEAIAMCAAAFQNEADIFQFPQEAALHIAMQHTSKVTNRNLSHGGS